MKVQDFLDIKDDSWGIKYYNIIGKECIPFTSDDVKKIKFLKHGESGMYHVFTNSVKELNIDNMTIDDIKKYCKEKTDCEQCTIHEFCLNTFAIIPRKW